MTDPLQAFCEKWFPITVRHARTDVDVRKTTVEWFGGSAVAQSYPFVVRTWFHYARLEEPDPGRPGYTTTAARGYDGLIVEIHEHGVGKLVEEWFMFEQFLQTKDAEGPLDPTWQKFFVEDGAFEDKASPPGLSWHVYKPDNIRELLDPVERYIELWLSENPAAAVQYTNSLGQRWNPE